MTNPAIIANAEDALVTSDFHFDGCPRKCVGGERLDEMALLTSSIVVIDKSLEARAERQRISHRIDEQFAA